MNKSNMEVVKKGGVKLCKSYGVIIASKAGAGALYIDRHYFEYSATTTKHLCKFFECNKKEIDKRLKAGVYRFASLSERGA